MTKKEKSNEVLFQTDDLRGVLTAWLNDSTSDPSSYLTKEGMSYLNGFCQANNTIGLIKLEKYNEVLENQKDLIEKYSKVLKQKTPLYRRILDYLF